MRKILQLLTFFLITNSFAQTNETSFDWSFNGGGGYNTSKRMHYNSKGDFIFLMDAGHQTIFGNTTVIDPGFGSFPGTVSFIGKRTQTGAKSVLIKKNIPNPSSATFHDFVIDNEDNIILTGATFGNNETIFYDFGNGIKLYGKGSFIAKFNSEGICQWANLITYNLTSNSYSENKNIGLGILPNNDIYFANRSTGYNAKYENPFWLIRFNPSGKEIWHKEWLMPNSRSIGIYTSKNNFFFDNTGKAYFFIQSLYGDVVTLDGTVLTPPTGGHPTTSSLLTINGDGTNGVFSTYRGSIGDIAVEKTTGNVLVDWRQYFQNPAPFNTLPMAANGTFQYVGIVALDANRNFVNRTEALFNVPYKSIFPLGNLSFVTNSVIVPTETVSASNQTFTATKYTPVWKFFENFVMTKFVAHPEINGTSTESYDLMALYKNKLAVSGSYNLVDNATVSINKTTLTSCVNDPNFATLYPGWATLQGDVFISQLTINETTLSNTSFDRPENLFYPNPTTGIVTISSPYKIHNVTLFDFLGKQLQFQNPFSQDTQLDLTNNISGIYFVKIELENGSTQIKKVIKN